MNSTTTLPTTTLSDFEKLMGNAQNEAEYTKALKFDELDKNKPYMLKEWYEVEFKINNENRTSAIGVLDDDTEFWMPKSLQRKIEDHEGPHMFVYKGRKCDKWKTYKVDVVLGDVLRAKGIIKNSQ